ncbi:MAG: ATP-dependent DNA ligase [Longimicrobiales bacterium]
MLLNDLVAVSRTVAATRSRLAKIGALADALRRAGPAEAPLAVAYLSGQPRQGRIGIGPAAVRQAWPESAALSPALTLRDVDSTLAQIASARGAGAARERIALLRELLARATSPEQDFLAGLIFGELRQGALEGVMIDAIARAAEVTVPEVRRALMLSGDASAVAAAALRDGTPALRSFRLRLFTPIQPMLAQTAEDPDAALLRFGRAALDFKLDGARVQIHKLGDEVRVYSRRLNEVTASVPELVAAVRGLEPRELVLDGEAIVLRADGRPQPFQVTMRRFGRKLELQRMQQELPLTPVFFDCLHVAGETLIDAPAKQRFAALEAVVPLERRVPRLFTADVTAARDFLIRAREAGHEGLVAKALETPYEAGRRGSGWLKLKATDTLDLVVLAAEWGHGRRQGWLSNLHLGARDPEDDTFVMLGKTFKGLTDAVLEWQTRELLAREIGREDNVVHVRPELVVEVAFEGVQASPRYSGGLALRFARVRRYRLDKGAREADTVQRVRGIFERVQ